MEDGIKWILRKIGCGRVNQIKLAQDKVQWRVFENMGMKNWIP
jgi:hypothetical protein